MVAELRLLAFGEGPFAPSGLGHYMCLARAVLPVLSSWLPWGPTSRSST